MAEPAVVTTLVDDIIAVGAFVYGELTDAGDPTPTQHGFCWSTSTTPTTSNAKVELGEITEVGVFNSPVSGLTRGTVYYIRAYVIADEITYYGNTLSFETFPLEGLGTSGNPYEIETLEQLRWLSNGHGSENWLPYDYWSDYFIQTANIDASASSGWYDATEEKYGLLPIGRYREGDYYDFTGVYDGQSYYIKNLYIKDLTSGFSYVGFIGSALYATIKNVTLIDASVEAISYVGLLNGYAYDTTIENCHVTGELKGTAGLGGITGAFDNWEDGTQPYIKNCSADVVVTAKKYTFSGSGPVIINDVGCLIGVAWVVSGRIHDCYAKGTIHGYFYDNLGSSAHTIGGFAGSIYLSDYNLNVYAMDMYARVIIINETGSDVSKVGGFVGDYCDFDESYAEVRPGTQLVNCYYSQEYVSLYDNDYGDNLTENQVFEKQYYMGFDFTSIWNHNKYYNDSLPYLLSRITTPSLDTIGYYGLTGKSMTVVGAVISCGDDSLLSYGVVAKIGGTPTIDDYDVITDEGTIDESETPTAFSSLVTGMTPNQTYNYLVYGQNSRFVGYGRLNAENEEE